MLIHWLLCDFYLPTISEGGLLSPNVIQQKVTHLDLWESYGRYTVLWPRVCSLPVWQTSYARNSKTYCGKLPQGVRDAMFDHWLIHIQKSNIWYQIIIWTSKLANGCEIFDFWMYRWAMNILQPQVQDEFAYIKVHASLSFTSWHNMFFVTRQCFYVSETLCTNVAICNIDMDF